MSKDQPRAPAAILTGDMIGSTDAGAVAVDTAMALLSVEAAKISAWPPISDRSSDQNTRFTRFRGDGWQIHIAEAALGLRATLILIARLRAAKTGLATRVAIGIGSVDSLGSTSLADARGAAFTASGQALDAMGKSHRLTAAGDGITDLHRAVLDLIDERSARWTPEQAEAMALALPAAAPTLAAIATQLGISPQAVNYRLAGAGSTAIRRTLTIWEASFGPALRKDH